MAIKFNKQKLIDSANENIATLEKELKQMEAGYKRRETDYEKKVRANFTNYKKKLIAQLKQLTVEAKDLSMEESFYPNLPGWNRPSDYKDPQNYDNVRAQINAIKKGAEMLELVDGDTVQLNMTDLSLNRDMAHFFNLVLPGGLDRYTNSGRRRY